MTPPLPVTRLPVADETWRASVRAFARDAVAPRVRAMDEAATLDGALLRELFDAGLMGVEVPESYGGTGGDLFRVMLVIEELATVDPAVAVLVDVQNALVVSAVLRHGDGDTRRRLLPRLATGTVGAYAISEADAGSDAFAMTTTAHQDGAGFVLSGAKRWTTNAAEAGLFLVFARTAGAGMTACLVDRDAAGVRVGEPVSKLGIRATSTCDVTFDDVRVRKQDVLGRPGGGEVIAVETLNIGRLGIAAQLVGLAEGALGAAVAHARDRRQFDRPILEFQGVAFPLADRSAELAAARTYLYDATRLFQHGGDAAERVRASAVAKHLAANVAERAAAQAVEIFGGAGVLPENGAEKRYRDAKIGKIYEGTTNMQLRAIAGLLARE
ncbi:acyl-CoA dehydrogenase family protein [Amycolatopsis suaedae]|uniref:short-chain 2-methylacyl-CoA dehydrogenase n=1 Tax=Amycolatopsis suaedae TaxID=2510978 RepID=A0A4Q7J334_9PSEU|nr:acyl-CoA dehydrogenase family protein [Amycolatopsis suaedae]RZQ61022.1 acyl-CoA dehydrogenase [Amycolatopsis suaedae]